jgi:hypothetical protein
MLRPNLSFYGDNSPLASTIQLNDLSSAVLVISPETIEKVIEIQNQSLTSATISSSIMSGTDATQYSITNTCTPGLELSPGQACIITVIYDPILPSLPAGHEIDIDIDYTNTDLPLDSTYSTSISIKSFSL